MVHRLIRHQLPKLQILINYLIPFFPCENHCRLAIKNVPHSLWNHIVYCHHRTLHYTILHDTSLLNYNTMYGTALHNITLNYATLVRLVREPGRLGDLGVNWRIILKKEFRKNYTVCTWTTNVLYFSFRLDALLVSFSSIWRLN